MVPPLRGWWPKRGEDDQSDKGLASNSDLNVLRTCRMASVQVDQKEMLLTQASHGSDPQDYGHVYVDLRLPRDDHRHGYGRD